MIRKRYIAICERCERLETVFTIPENEENALLEAIQEFKQRNWLIIEPSLEAYCEKCTALEAQEKASSDEQ